MSYEASGTLRFLVVLIAGIVGLTAGCGAFAGITRQESPSPSAQNAPEDVPERHRAGRWEIEYEVSGGIAGIDRRLMLSGNGIFTASDLKKKRNVERQTSPGQLADIRNALAKLDFSRMPEARSKFPGRCADCFQHRLTVVIEGQGHGLHFTDVSLRDSEYAPLIGLLASLLDQALSNMKPDR